MSYVSYIFYTYTGYLMPRHEMFWPVAFANSFVVQADPSDYGQIPYFSEPNQTTEAFTCLGETHLTDYAESDYLFPRMWTHIENGNTRIQGVTMYRKDSDEGDNVRILKRNMVDYKADILSAISAAEGSNIDEEHFIGVAWLPLTDRLNA